MRAAPAAPGPADTGGLSLSFEGKIQGTGGRRLLASAGRGILAGPELETNKTHLETRSFIGLENYKFSISIVSLELIVTDPNIEEEERSKTRL